MSRKSRSIFGEFDFFVGIIFNSLSVFSQITVYEICSRSRIKSSDRIYYGVGMFTGELGEMK